MQTVATQTEFETVLSTPVLLLYKHSATCPISAMSYDEVERLADAHPELPIYVVDVHAQRPLSLFIAAHFGIRHESPQAILVCEGRPVWHGSHYRVTAHAIRREMDGLAANRETSGVGSRE